MAQQTKVVLPVKDISWWIGISNHSETFPMKNGYYANLESNYGNQVQPLLLSYQGQVIRSEDPFEVLLKDDTLVVTAQTSSLIYTKPGTNLKEGFKFASKKIIFHQTGSCLMSCFFLHLSIIHGLNWFTIKTKPIF